MCDKELLVAYVYDEVEPAERRTFESHLLTCGECRSEMKAFRGVRTTLGSWAPQEPELEFQIIRRPAAAAPSRSWMRSPAWGLAAAAVLLLSVASAIANVEVRYGTDGLTVRTGWARTGAPAPVAAAGLATVSAKDDAFRVQLQTINQRLHDLESSAGNRPVMTAVHTASVQTPTDTLRQVRQMLADSESRQERELALRIAQVLRDVLFRNREPAIDGGSSLMKSFQSAFRAG